MPRPGGIGGVIGVGCGLAVFTLVALIFGGAYVVMQARAHVEVRSQIQEMTLAYLPRILLTSRIQADALALQRAIEAYALTEDPVRLPEARAIFTALEKHTEDLQDLSEKASMSETHRIRIHEMRLVLMEWSQTLDRLEGTLTEYVQVREEADKAAAACATAARDRLKRELAAAHAMAAQGNDSERLVSHLTSLALTQDIFDAASNARMTLWRGEALRESALLPQSLESLDRLAGSLLALRAATETRDDINLLEGSLNRYREALSALIDKRVAVREAHLEQAGHGRKLLEGTQEMLKESLTTLAATTHDALKRLGGSIAGP